VIRNMQELSPNTKLKHYRIVSKIGEGGMGEVYLAEDTLLERKVAIKILSEEFSFDGERLRRFIQEAKAASALNHPNILTIHEIGKSEGTHFIASEYICGETLHDHLSKRALSVEQVLNIAIQIADALTAAHAAGIIHRDIKPENVMIRDDEIAKVLDFGLAKLTLSAAADADTRPQVHTRSGMIIGTASYMSPEQARGKTVDERTDIFSLGIVMYKMLTGRLPFDGETMSDTIASILNAEPKRVSALNPDTPVELERIIAKTLEKNREERYQSAKDLLVDLKHLEKRLEIKKEIERTAQPHSGPRQEVTKFLPTNVTGKLRRRTLVTASVFGLAMIAAVTLGFWYFNGGSAKQIESIAVMPFVNESGNADLEYLSDGMTESLINSLSNLPKLSVKARNSVFRYKGTEIDEKKIGQDLNVQAVVLGRVTQRGDDLTLYLSLIDAGTGNSLWGEQYIRKLKDLAALQTEITRDVSQKLRTRLSSADEKLLTKNYTENAEAYQLYLKGRYFWNKRSGEDFQKSRDYFQRAIDLDPTYALAYSGLADFYGLSASQGQLPPNETWSKQEALVLKALELDPNLAEVHNSLAGLKRNFYRDWVGAEEEFKRAIELNPNYAEVHAHYGGLLTTMERFDEGLSERKRALELDPLSPNINMRLGDTLYQMQRFEEAIDQYQKSLELDPGSIMTRNRLGDAYERKGMHQQAIAEWSSALKLSRNNDLAAVLEQTFKEAGFDAAVRVAARKRLELLTEKMRRGEYTPARDIARLYMRVGNREQAFVWLEKAVEERNALAFEIKRDPIFESLRADPRFADILRRIGGPQ
jgi:serine/threonine protein kinase